MPRNDSGQYNLPPGSEAVTGTTIQASTHNTPLNDIAQALTDSLPRNGSAPMLAPLRLPDGSLAAPAAAFNSATNTGLIRTASGIGFVVNGALAVEVSASGFTSGVPIGAGMDWWGDTAPPGWAFSFGQALSRTTFAALFAVYGTKYGAGDGSTTFNLPDKRGRASFGKDDMGGVSANRLTGLAGGIDGDVLGGTGGAEAHTLTAGQLPANIPASASSSSSTSTVAPSPFAILVGAGGSVIVGSGSSSVPVATGGVSTLPSTTSTFTSVSVNPSGGGAHNNLPPGIVCNYIVFTGV